MTPTEIMEIRDALRLEGCAAEQHSDAIRRALAENRGGAASSGTQRLTSREVEVVRLVARGLTNPAIAARLGVSPHTVKRHIANVFAKENVNSRAQAAVLVAQAQTV